MVHYDLNDDDLLNERNFGAEFTTRSGGGGGQQQQQQQQHLSSSSHHRHHEESELLHDRDSSVRYQSSNQPTQLSRRDNRDEYSPHRGGGNSRRVLNAM